MKRIYRVCLAIILQGILAISCGAISSTKPSQLATSFINDLAENNIDEALALLSSKAIKDAGGLDVARYRLGPFNFRLKVGKLEVLSMKVARENIAGLLADVDVNANLRAFPKPSPGGGAVGPPEEANVMFRFTFGKEGQEWKINRVTMDPGTEARQSPPTPSSTQIPSLDDEAIAAVKDLWDQHTTRCGDSYFSSENFRGIITLHQYKNISFVARRTSPTNEADKLNGILWNGDVQISIGLYRDKHEGQWHEWKQGNKGYDIGATKRQTGWSVLQLLHVTDQRKVKCSEIP